MCLTMLALSIHTTVKGVGLNCKLAATFPASAGFTLNVVNFWVSGSGPLKRTPVLSMMYGPDLVLSRGPGWLQRRHHPHMSYT